MVPEWALKVHISYMKKWPKCPSSHCSCTNFSLPDCTYGFMGNSLRSFDRVRADLSLVYRQLCLKCRQHCKVDNYSTTVPSWGIPDGQM